MLRIVEETRVGEALTCRHGLEDEGREGRDEAAGGAVILHVEGSEALGGLANGDSMPLLVHDVREVKIRELAQNKAVYLVERVDIKGDVSSPGEVVEDVAHVPPFALVCHAPMMPRITDILAGNAPRLRRAFTTWGSAVHAAPVSGYDTWAYSKGIHVSEARQTLATLP